MESRLYAYRHALRFGDSQANSLLSYTIGELRRFLPNRAIEAGRELMADFQVHELEGTRFVEIHLNHEMVRVEAGALSYLKGDISIHSPLVPSVGGMIKSALASQVALSTNLCWFRGDHT